MTRLNENGERFSLCETKFAQCINRFTKDKTSIRLNSIGLISKSEIPLSRKILPARKRKFSWLFVRK